MASGSVSPGEGRASAMDHKAAARTSSGTTASPSSAAMRSGKDIGSSFREPDMGRAPLGRGPKRRGMRMQGEREVGVPKAWRRSTANAEEGWKDQPHRSGEAWERPWGCPVEQNSAQENGT